MSACGLALCGHGCPCDGRNPSHPSIVSDRARRLTDRLFALARAGEFYTAACRVDEVLEEVRTQAYEDGRNAARRETAA